MKKTIKKIMCAVSTAILMSSLIGGCGSSAAKDSEGNATITYALWDKNQEAGMKKIAEAFEQKNPGIKVNVEVTPWDQYWTKLEAGASGNSMPDVFWMHSNQSYKYASNGILMDLSDANVDYSKFPKDLVDLYKVNDKNYAVPKDFDTIGLWYNKTLFDEAGIAYPDETWTWDNMLDAARKLTNESEGIYGFAAPLNLQEGIDNFIYQNGGQVFSDDKTKSAWDTPEVKEAVQWYVDLSLKEKVSPTQKQFAENTNTVFFESGKVAMYMAGSWMLGELAGNDYVKANCDVAVLPQGKKRASIYNGLGNAVAASTSHPEEAKKFVEFLGSEEANKLQAESGAAIPAYEGTSEAWVKSNDKFNLQCYVDMLDYAVIKPYSNETIKWQTLQEATLNKAFSGEEDVSKVCDEVAKQVTEVLASEK
ncbi:MAG: sugar ABC transporter substrate-binding protein [Clostridium butyricum]|nr:sugar ABC transporter substrate-binding protein [Clostridium butyricum]